MSYIRGDSREQIYLLPEAIDDYVGPENPVRFLDVFVEKLGRKFAAGCWSWSETTRLPPEGSRDDRI